MYKYIHLHQKSECIIIEYLNPSFLFQFLRYKHYKTCYADYIVDCLWCSLAQLYIERAALPPILYLL